MNGRRPALVILICAGAFLLALGLRVSNASVAFTDDLPQISLLDDLYHLKRMAFAAAHFPHILDFDRDRGERGAFCPWPPGYDFAAGSIARFFGARAAGDVLRRVVWFPPLVAALFIAVTAAIVARRFGWEAGAVLAVALAASPFLIAEESIGNIDHHFLEAPLTFGILAATCAAIRVTDRRRAIVTGVWLGVALTAALFVRTSLLIAAALSFAALFAFSGGLAAACGFGIAAAAVSLYRLTRPPNYPAEQWFLGWSHAAILGAAAVAGAVLFLRGRSMRNRIFALVCGTAVVLATPSAPGSILFGSEYFGGNAWFHTIVEGQPMWSLHGGQLVWKLAGLSTGAILVWFLIAFAVRRRDAVLGTVAMFAAAYLLLTLTNMRYWSASIPLLALAAVLYAASLPPRLRFAVLLLIAAPVVIQFGMWRRNPPEPVIGRRELPWIRAANFLRGQRDPGRVLAPWSIGHVIDVIGQRAVIIDNFGVMSDEVSFDRAHDAFLAIDEDALWRYCRNAGIRYIVLENPLYGLQGVAATLGLDRQAYVRTTDRAVPTGVTRLARSTWWWRSYYGQSQTSRRFRRIYVDRDPSWEGTAMFRGPALVIWERSDG